MPNIEYFLESIIQLALEAKRETNTDNLVSLLTDIVDDAKTALEKLQGD